RFAGRPLAQGGRALPRLLLLAALADVDPDPDPFEDADQGEDDQRLPREIAHRLRGRGPFHHRPAPRRARNSSSAFLTVFRTLPRRIGVHPRSQPNGPKAWRDQRQKEKRSTWRTILPFRNSNEASITLCTRRPVALNG